MKKVFLVVAVAAFALGACNKKDDYRCDCTYEEEHGDHTDSETAQLVIEDSTEDDAKDACDDLKATLEADDHNSEVKCDLK